jgi:hypothetical protein
LYSKSALLTTLTLAGVLLANICQAAAWDAEADFTPTTISNPNGVWTSGYDPAAIAGYQLKSFNSLQHLGISPIWQDSAYVTLNVPAFYKNTGSTTLNGLLPDQVALHPGPVVNEDAAILRFTAPSTGIYAVKAKFFAGDSGETDAWVVKNGDFLTPLSSLGITSTNPTFASSGLQLSLGDTLDFVVGNHGNFFGDSTPLTVQISPVPELSSMSLMLAGLGLVWLTVRRGRGVKRFSGGSAMA